MKKGLILGASGFIGKALINEWKAQFELYGTYFSKPSLLPIDHQFQFDVKQTERLKNIIEEIKPDFFISCLRGNFEHQFIVHKKIAEVLKNQKCLFYYLSTTNVFDNDLSSSHTEADTPNAGSEYGKFKIKCENMLRSILDKNLIVIRIPAIWGKDSPRLNEITASVQNNKEIDVYSNLLCNNLSDVLLAKQLRYIIENQQKGTFHLGSQNMISQAKFYKSILDKLADGKELLRIHYYEDKTEDFYFCLQSNRNVLPESLQCTNEDVIAYLLS